MASRRVYFGFSVSAAAKDQKPGGQNRGEEMRVRFHCSPITRFNSALADQ